jgi:hypothetical protein
MQDRVSTIQDRVSTTQDRVSTTENRTTQMENVSNTQTGIMTGGVMGSRSTTATSISSYSSSTPVILSDGNTSVQLITNPNPTISINGLSRYLV